MVHRRMRQLSLTETNTFVNLAKHALETLNASDDEDRDDAFKAGSGSRSGVQPPGHYSDEANDNDEDTAESSTAAGAAPSCPSTLKTTRSEPLFAKKRQKRLEMISGMEQMEESVEETAEGARSRFLQPPDVAGDEDILQFVARSHSDVRLENAEGRQDDDADHEQQSGDETSRLTASNSVLLC